MRWPSRGMGGAVRGHVASGGEGVNGVGASRGFSWICRLILLLPPSCWLLVLVPCFSCPSFDLLHDSARGGRAVLGTSHRIQSKWWRFRLIFFSWTDRGATTWHGLVWGGDTCALAWSLRRTYTLKHFEIMMANRAWRRVLNVQLQRSTTYTSGLSLVN